MNTGLEHQISAKEELRQRARANRRHLSIDHQRVCNGLAHFLGTLSRDRGRPLRTIVGYAAMPTEPDLTALLRRVDLGQMALTRTPDGADRMLSVHPADSELETHRFGFTQPVAGSAPIADSDIDVVLVPGLAFDRHGGRLGFGAGYYDRFLARLEAATRFVAISDGFIVERVPTEPHDIAMTHLATEAGVVALPLGTPPGTTTP